MNPDEKPSQEAPAVDHKPVPAWIKVMWLFAVIWMLAYVLLGLKTTPTSW